MVSKPVMSADDRRWRAESDARTLKDSLEIANDPARSKEAQKLIKKQLNDLAKLTGNKVVSSTTKNKKAPKKTTTKKKGR